MGTGNKGWQDMQRRTRAVLPTQDKEPKKRHMSLCTFCPANTIRCAHLDTMWVRLVHERHAGYLPYGVFWSWPAECSDIGFYHSTRTPAKEEFNERESKMRIIAMEVSGDD